MWDEFDGEQPAWRKPQEGDHTRWGKITRTKEHTASIVEVHTLNFRTLTKVSSRANRAIPPVFRSRSGWYRGSLNNWFDFDTITYSGAAVIGAFLGQHLLDECDDLLIRTDVQEGTYWRALSDDAPLKYERAFKYVLKPGESVGKDRHSFYVAAVGRWVAISMERQPSEPVPHGYCVVHAAKYASPHWRTTETTRFVVPVKDFDLDAPFGCVVDETTARRY